MSISTSVELSRCRLAIIDNHISKKSMDSLWNTYGGDNKVLMNGPFFHMTTKEPLGHIKINGNVLKKPNYQEYGIAWNEGEPPVWTILPNEFYQNYFTNTVVLINYTERMNLTSHLDADGTKAKPRLAMRPAFGFSNGYFEVCVERNISLWDFQHLLRSKTWSSGIVGDGGASTGYRDKTNRIVPGRTVPYWILITILDNEPKGEKPMIEINAYSLKKDGAKTLSKNFKVREFKCTDGTDTIFVAPKLVEILQAIRDMAKKPVNINSGYRTEVQNKKVGGAEFSQHKYGTAADINVSGMAPKELYKIAETVLGDTGGIGLYPWGIHVDVRETKSRWNG